jgi:hypothetical protein
MTGKVQEKIKALDEIRGEIVATRLQLAEAEEAERELLRQILELCTEEVAGESLWDQGSSTDGDFKMAFAVKDRWGAVRVAVVKIKEDFYEFAAHMRFAAVEVGFVHFVQQS